VAQLDDVLAPGYLEGLMGWRTERVRTAFDAVDRGQEKPAPRCRTAGATVDGLPP
jgi:hypothetical protein